MNICEYEQSRGVKFYVLHGLDCASFHDDGVTGALHNNCPAIQYEAANFFVTILFAGFFGLSVLGMRTRAREDLLPTGN